MDYLSIDLDVMSTDPGPGTRGLSSTKEHVYTELLRHTEVILPRESLRKAPRNDRRADHSSLLRRGSSAIRIPRIKPRTSSMRLYPG